MSKVRKAELAVKFSAADFMLIAVVGVVSIACVGVFLLPVETQDMLKVRFAMFDPLTWITASFVHGNLQHLELNLLGFVLFASFLYFIDRKVSRQLLFFCSIPIMFVVLPLFNYGFLYYCAQWGIWRPGEFGYGLSLVDSGLIGFTVPSLILFFKARLEEFKSMLFFISIVLFTFCLVLLPYVASVPLLLFAFIFMVISGFVVGMPEFKRILRFVVQSFRQRETFVESYALMLTLLLYVTFIISLFLPNIVSEEGWTVAITHYMGLLFGIFPFSWGAILQRFSD